MWYEILPSLAVVGGGLALTHVATYWLNQFFLGNHYKRMLRNSSEAHYFLRDMRISGVDNGYIQKNLDCLPTDESSAAGGDLFTPIPTKADIEKEKRKQKCEEEFNFGNK